MSRRDCSQILGENDTSSSSTRYSDKEMENSKRQSKIYPNPTIAEIQHHTCHTPCKLRRKHLVRGTHRYDIRDHSPTSRKAQKTRVIWEESKKQEERNTWSNCASERTPLVLSGLNLNDQHNKNIPMHSLRACECFKSAVVPKRAPARTRCDFLSFFLKKAEHIHNPQNFRPNIHLQGGNSSSSKRPLAIPGGGNKPLMLSINEDIVDLQSTHDGKL